MSNYYDRFYQKSVAVINQYSNSSNSSDKRPTATDFFSVAPHNSQQDEVVYNRVKMNDRRNPSACRSDDKLSERLSEFGNFSSPEQHKRDFSPSSRSDQSSSSSERSESPLRKHRSKRNPSGGSIKQKSSSSSGRRHNSRSPSHRVRSSRNSRSPSHRKKKSRSPTHHRRKSRSPPNHRRISRSPPKHGRHSSSRHKRRRDSSSPSDRRHRRNSRSPSGRRHRENSRSPSGRRHRRNSRSPSGRRHRRNSRSPSGRRRRQEARSPPSRKGEYDELASKEQFGNQHPGEVNQHVIDPSQSVMFPYNPMGPLYQYPANHMFYQGINTQFQPPGVLHQQFYGSVPAVNSVPGQSHYGYMPANVPPIPPSVALGIPEENIPSEDQRKRSVPKQNKPIGRNSDIAVIFTCCEDAAVKTYALDISRQLSETELDLTVEVVYCLSSRVSTYLESAPKGGVYYALVVHPENAKEKTVTVHTLRGVPQEYSSMPLDAALIFLKVDFEPYKSAYGDRVAREPVEKTPESNNLIVMKCQQRLSHNERRKKRLSHIQKKHDTKTYETEENSKKGKEPVDRGKLQNAIQIQQLSKTVGNANNEPCALKKIDGTLEETVKRSKNNISTNKQGSKPLLTNTSVKISDISPESKQIRQEEVKPFEFAKPRPILDVIKENKMVLKSMKHNSRVTDSKMPKVSNLLGHQKTLMLEKKVKVGGLQDQSSNESKPLDLKVDAGNVITTDENSDNETRNSNQQEVNIKQVNSKQQVNRMGKTEQKMNECEIHVMVMRADKSALSKFDGVAITNAISSMLLENRNSLSCVSFRTFHAHGGIVFVFSNSHTAKWLLNRQLPVLNNRKFEMDRVPLDPAKGTIRLPENISCPTNTDEFKSLLLSNHLNSGLKIEEWYPLNLSRMNLKFSRKFNEIRVLISKDDKLKIETSRCLISVGHPSVKAQFFFK